MFFGLGDRLKLTEIAPGSLLLENRRLAALFDVVFRVLFLGAWYYVFGSGATSLGDWFERVRIAVERNIGLVLFLAFPLLFVPDLMRKVRVIFTGSCVLFDGLEQRIHVNNQEVARFKHVAHVRVSKFRGARGSITYGLCVDLKDRRWLEIDKGGHPTEYLTAANMIARIVHADIVEDVR